MKTLDGGVAGSSAAELRDEIGYVLPVGEDLEVQSIDGRVLLLDASDIVDLQSDRW